MKVAFGVTVGSRGIVQTSSHSNVSRPRVERALLPPFFLLDRNTAVRVWSGPVDCQWCSLASYFFFCLSQAWGGSIIEKSAGPFSSSSKSFAYILCSHTNHQLSGLAVFVLEDCMAVAVSRLILAVTVKERRNFLLFCMRVTLIHLLYGSVNEIWWLKSLAAEGEGTFGKKNKKKKLTQSKNIILLKLTLSDCFRQSRFHKWSWKSDKKKQRKKMTAFINQSSCHCNPTKTCP